MSRPRHPDGSHEALFKLAEKRGWRVTGGGNTHYQMFCPCKLKHIVTVSTTPRNVTGNLRMVIRNLRKLCWREP